MSTTNEPSGQPPLFDRSGGLASTLADYSFRGSVSCYGKMIDLRRPPVIKMKIRPEGWLSGRKRRS
jgi:hypothetical protein